MKNTLSILAICAAGAAAADGHACGTVTFSDVGWTDITATTAATTVVLRHWVMKPTSKFYLFQ